LRQSRMDFGRDDRLHPLAQTSYYPVKALSGKRFLDEWQRPMRVSLVKFQQR
jgi:hypothetical protein